MDSPDASQTGMISEVRRLGELSQSTLAKLESLGEELIAIKQQLRPVEPLSKSQRQVLRVFFDRTSLERKPFSLSMSGVLDASINLSPVRAAILLVAFVDLLDREQGGLGISNPVAAISQVLRRIESSESSDAALTEKVRVALYRFEQFIQGAPEFNGKICRLSFHSKSERLRFLPEEERPSIDLSFGDSLLSEIGDELFTTSPLERLRKLKTMYVPPGPQGLDRLLLELYEHSHPMRVRSLYFRPSLLSCPRDVLESLNVSSSVLHRYELAMQGMSGGRIEVTEILREESLWELIRSGNDREFSFYPHAVTPEHVIAHLDHLIWRVSNLSGFNLVLTRADFPLHVVTYELHVPTGPEFFTVCFRQARDKKFPSDVAAYLVNDQVVAEVMTNNILEWVLLHPSTSKEKLSVVEKITEIKDYLRRKGPLPPLAT